MIRPIVNKLTSLMLAKVSNFPPCSSRYDTVFDTYIALNKASQYKFLWLFLVIDNE